MELDLSSRWKNRMRKHFDLSQFLLELDELFADELFYDPDDYVERLAWKISSVVNDNESDIFDPAPLYKAFEQAIEHLEVSYNTRHRQCSCLQMICDKAQKAHKEKANELIEKNKAAFSTFQELDERIDFVATKVVHLGDQLESVNTPRARAVEAQILMNHFAEVLNPNLYVQSITSFKESNGNQLYEAADVIQKLYLIAQELPSGKPKFEKARHSIATKYDEIERELIEQFVSCHESDNRAKMKELAGVLYNFKGYSQCIDAFIEQRQKSLPPSGDILTRIVPSCVEAQVVIQQVFMNPEEVMSKYILNIFHGKLQQHIQEELSSCGQGEQYLSKFERLYARTMKLTQDLNKFNIGNDSTFLKKLTKHIFSKYLENYINLESRCLKMKCENLLNKYYTERNHEKKTIHFGGIHELRRDIQAMIASKTNYISNNPADRIGAEILLSEEVAMHILEESRKTFNRCHMLSKNQSDLPGNTFILFEILITYLFQQHVLYAMEFGLIAIPAAESKICPSELQFFDIIRLCNVIYHLFEKQFQDTIIPLVMSTPRHGDCLQKKREIVKTMETKLHSGLDRCIALILNWVRCILQSEQRKTDFKPETEMATFDADKSTVACSNVVKFISDCVKKIKASLDGKNMEIILTELGTRFHRVIVDHLQQFQYSSIGAMVVICDINEYRRCVREFQIPLLDTLFETLHALCNLLVVEPSNLKQMCCVEQLACLDRTVLMTFVQLRADYKTARLVNQFK